MLDVVLAGARFVHFAAALLAFGACIFPLYAGVAPPFPMRVAAAASFLSAAIWLLCVVIVVEGAPLGALTMSDVGVVIFQTGFGHAWLLHLALGVAWIGSSVTGTARTVAVVVGAHLVSLAGIGHAAAGSGPSQIAHALGYMTHLCAAGVWLGGLAPLWRACASADPHVRRRLVRRFSMAGCAAVFLVILSGVANMRFVTGAYLPSQADAYGQLLLLKLALVAALLAIVAFNQFVAARRDDWPALRWGFIAELAAFCGILLIVSLLGITPPM